MFATKTVSLHEQLVSLLLLSLYLHAGYLNVIQQKKPSRQDLERYHMYPFSEARSKNDDSVPHFPGYQDYMHGYLCGSAEGACRISGCDHDAGSAAIAINWHGGHHHGKRAYAAGFCGPNDVVLAADILSQHGPENRPVMVVDLDVHHGDGTEKAFLHSSKVYTFSVHRHQHYMQGNSTFYPGTGSVADMGRKNEPGYGWCANLALPRNTPPQTYVDAFKRTFDTAYDLVKPKSVIVVFGADGLIGDAYGDMLNSMDHMVSCLQHVASKELPMLVTGAGGYNVERTVQCWSYATLKLAGLDKQEILDMADLISADPKVRGDVKRFLPTAAEVERDGDGTPQDR